MSKAVELLCPDSSDVRLEAGRLLYGMDRAEPKRVNSRLLDSFTSIVDDRTALAFARRYGPIVPLRVANADGFYDQPVSSSIEIAAELLQIRQGPRNPKYRPLNYRIDENWLQTWVGVLRVSPWITDFATLNWPLSML